MSTRHKEKGGTVENSTSRVAGNEALHAFKIRAGKLNKVINNTNPPVGGEILKVMKNIIKEMANVCRGMVIFLLAMVPIVIVHRIIVVAKFPKQVDLLITRIYAIIEAMTDNAWFPTPSPGLPAVKTATDNLKTAQVLARQRSPGSAKDRDVKKKTLLTLVSALMYYIQGICDANPASAVTIAESALFYGKKVGGNKPRGFNVTSKIASICELTGSIKGKRCYHDWQMSLDGKDITSWYVRALPSTLQAKTTVDGLTSGVRVYFRHRIVTKDGPGAWDQVINIIVS